MSNPSNGAAPTHPLAPYDALLLVSFGGPEGPDEVIDFLEIVTKGSGVPRERLEHVGEHYFRFGGRSPINDQNRALIAALHSELADRGADMPIYWGNRNWHPFITQALEEIVTAGHHRVLMLTTSAYPMTAAFLGVLIAAGVGALCGIIPAFYAVRIKPIDAIRY